MKQNEKDMETSYSKEIVLDLKKRLPNVGAYELINSRLKAKGLKTYSKGSITQILNYNRRNDQVIIAAKEVVEEFELQIRGLNSKE